LKIIEITSIEAKLSIIFNINNVLLIDIHIMLIDLLYYKRQLKKTNNLQNLFEIYIYKNKARQQIINIFNKYKIVLLYNILMQQIDTLAKKI